MPRGNLRPWRGLTGFEVLALLFPRSLIPGRALRRVDGVKGGAGAIAERRLRRS